MSFPGSGGGGAMPPSRLRALVQALQSASYEQQPTREEAQPGGRRGLIGSGYQAFWAGSPRD